VATESSITDRASVLPSETSEEQLTPIPALDDVLLSREEERELERRFQSISGDDAQEVSTPDMNSHPTSQRSLGPVKLVSHGQGTERFVNMIQAMCNVTRIITEQWQRIYDIEGPVEAMVSPDALPTSSGEDSALEVSDSIVNDWTPGRSTRRSEFPASKDLEGSLDTDEDDLDDFFVYGYKRQRGKHSGPRRSSSPPGMQDQPKLFYEPTHFTAMDDTNDDDLPELGDLLGGKAARPLRPPLKDTYSDCNAGRQAQGQRGKRRVVEDSDE
jgi:hypothetical protein